MPKDQIPTGIQYDIKFIKTDSKTPNNIKSDQELVDFKNKQIEITESQTPAYKREDDPLHLNTELPGEMKLSDLRNALKELIQTKSIDDNSLLLVYDCTTCYKHLLRVRAVKALKADYAGEKNKSIIVLYATTC